MAWPVSKIPQIVRFEIGKSIGQFFGIVVANAKHDAGVGMRHDGAGHFGIALQLVQFVVGQRQADAIFPRSAQNLRHGRRDEIGKLVYVEPKVPPRRDLLRLPAHGNLLKFGNEQRAKQIRIFPAKQSLRQFRQKDFAAVHDVREIQPVLRLRHHVADWLLGKERVKPRQNRADGLVAGQDAENFSASNIRLRNL